MTLALDGTTKVGCMYIPAGYAAPSACPSAAGAHPYDVPFNGAPPAAPGIPGIPGCGGARPGIAGGVPPRAGGLPVIVAELPEIVGECLFTGVVVPDVASSSPGLSRCWGVEVSEQRAGLTGALSAPDTFSVKGGCFMSISLYRGGDPGAALVLMVVFVAGNLGSISVRLVGILLVSEFNFKHFEPFSGYFLTKRWQLA
jgi:hypothetical protein